MKSTLLSEAALALLLLAGCDTTTTFDPQEAITYCVGQSEKTRIELQNRTNDDYRSLPHCIVSQGKHWRCHATSNEVWTAGFWPGILWYDFEATTDESWRKEAENYTQPLAELATLQPPYDHNLGLQIFASFGNGYRITHNEAYKQVLFDAAENMALLYNQKTHCMLSSPQESKTYDWQLSTTIGNLASMEILFWVAAHGGDHRYYDIALSHGYQSIQHHFYADGTVSQIAVYDTISGDFIKHAGIKSFNDSTVWSRGQAWAIYGLTMYYRETKLPIFLEYAQKSAEAYLSYLPQNDYIPFWDLKLPQGMLTQKDASAACIVASALIELSQYAEPAIGAGYLDAAKRILKNLTLKYQCRDSNSAFIKHCTGNWPLGFEIDSSLIYADYYYLEALLRLRTLQQKN